MYRVSGAQGEFAATGSHQPPFRMAREAACVESLLACADLTGAWRRAVCAHRPAPTCEGRASTANWAAAGQRAGRGEVSQRNWR